MSKTKRLRKQRNVLLILILFPLLPLALIFLIFRPIARKGRERIAIMHFAQLHDRKASSVMTYFREYRKGLEVRLANGVLCEMVEKARQIEPLITPPTSHSIIHIPPLSNKTSLKCIKAMTALQAAVDRKRAHVIIVTSNKISQREHQKIYQKLQSRKAHIVSIDTSKKTPLTGKDVIPFYGVAPELRGIEDAITSRILFEFIRSMHPSHVVIAESDLMWRVMLQHGRALAISSPTSAFFPNLEDSDFNYRFYRYFDILARVYLSDALARTALQERFMLTTAQMQRLFSLATDEETAHPPKSPVCADLSADVRGVDAPVIHPQTLTDISLIVTAHDETIVTGPNMRAADASARAAEAAGYSIERIIAFDLATNSCRHSLAQPAYSHWRRIDIDEGDLGATRNRVVRMARGRFIAFLDADDLFSENWLVEGAKLLEAMEKCGSPTIVHPEINWIFDGEDEIAAVTEQESPIFAPSHFYFANYYDSLCMAPRRAHLEIPYVSRDIFNGLSYQDYQFAVETIAAGWVHKVAKNTIIFKRRRDTSLVTQSRDRRAVIRQIEPMAIDRVQSLAGLSSRASISGVL